MIDENNSQTLEKATFAGGCFWCMEQPFKDIPGVIDVIPGYTGGHKANPTYAEVCSGTTGHYEAVQITYNAERISFNKLLDVFWRQIDPTDTGGQFYDRGQQYGTAIFYNDENQKAAAEKSKKQLEQSGRFNKPIAVKILKESEFYPAEEYHQCYYLKNPEHYSTYKKGSGREVYIEKMWGDINSVDS